MKTRERLLFMTIGGLLVLAGMIVGQFVFSTAQAQDGAQDAVFRTVRCEKLTVGNSLNHKAVRIGSFGGVGFVAAFNKAGEMITGLAATDDGCGVIKTYSNTGKVLVALTAGGNSTGEIGGGIIGGGIISVNNAHGVEVVNIQANKDKDGAIGLFDRYGDLGWFKTGKQ